MSNTPRTDAEVVQDFVNSDDHRVVDATDYWAMTEFARQLELELNTMTLEHANALGTAADLQHQLAQSEALYAQVVLGSRELQRELKKMTDYAELASDVIRRAKIVGERS